MGGFKAGVHIDRWSPRCYAVLMVRLFQIVSYCCLIFVAAGCNGPEEMAPLQDIKITELAPATDTRPRRGDFPVMIDFNVFTFEVPAEKIGVFEEVRSMLYKKPLRYTDYNAFKANSFVLGFGRTEAWDKVGNLLRKAGGRRAGTSSLSFADGQSNDLTITRLKSGQLIYYVSTTGSIESAPIGPGRLVLRLTAQTVPGERGVCRVNALPVFMTFAKGPLAILPPGPDVQEGQFAFIPAAFRLKMSGGDFVLLGPKKYIDHRTTLSGAFFSRPGRKAFFRVYLIVCAGIND